MTNVPKEVEAEFERSLDDYEEKLYNALKRRLVPAEKQVEKLRSEVMALETTIDKGDVVRFPGGKGGNPNHDEKGRFAAAPGGGSESVSSINRFVLENPKTGERKPLEITSDSEAESMADKLYDTEDDPPFIIVRRGNKRENDLLLIPGGPGGEMYTWAPRHIADELSDLVHNPDKED